MASQQDPAERAFDHLRAEVTIMRRAVEELSAAVEEGRAPDYAEALAHIVKTNTVIARNVEHIAGHTGARLPPDQYEREMTRAADLAFRPVRQALDGAERRLMDAAQRFDSAQAMMRNRAHQREQVWRALAIGASIGVLLIPLLLLPLLRLLPKSWGVPEALAAGVVGGDPWTAGQRIMSDANPAGFDYVREGWRLRDAGGDRLRDCLDRAEKSGEPERCTVTLTPRR